MAGDIYRNQTANQMQGIGSQGLTGAMMPTPIPDRVQDVLRESLRTLNEAHVALDGVEASMQGPVPTSHDMAESPAGVTGLAFEVRRLSALLTQRLNDHLARL